MKLGEQLTEARKDSERELLIIRCVRLLAEGDLEGDAASETGSSQRSRRNDEARGMCIAGAALGLFTSADAMMEIVQTRYVEMLTVAS